MKWYFSNDAPIYAQLIGQIRRGIVSGVFPPGERLPSVRELATEAGVNPNTMQRAMAELERDGLVAVKADKEDARGKKVRLTKKGNIFMQEVLPPHYLRVTKLMEKLSEEEQREVIALLHKLTED